MIVFTSSSVSGLLVLDVVVNKQSYFWVFTGSPGVLASLG